MPRAAPHMDAVVDWLHQHGESRVMEIAAGVGAGPTHVSNTLSRLRKKGEVGCVRRGVYRLIESPAANDAPAEWLQAPGGGDAESIMLPHPLPNTGLQLANPMHLQQALTALARWCADYSGPADNPTAVSVVMASMHLQRALGAPDSDLG